MRPDQVVAELKRRQQAAEAAPALLEQLVTQAAATRLPPGTGMTVSRTHSGVSVSFNGEYPQAAARNTQRRLEADLSRQMEQHLRSGS